MRTLFNLKRGHYLIKLAIFLTTVALVVCMVGCGSGQYSLTIHCTEGGRVFYPGEGTFNYDYGTVVYLEAVADTCYEFVNWVGDAGTIADVEISTTTITMHGSYVITANFVPKVSENLEIWDWYDLDAVRDNLCGNHTLMTDLDSTTTGYGELAGPMANGGRGWQPIGFMELESSIPFKGTFDGQGYEIHDLIIHNSYFLPLGLFGLSGGVIKNIGVVNATVIGVDALCVGALVGDNLGTVSNSYSTGNVSGDENFSSSVGGLVGYNSRGTVIDSYSTASVTGAGHDAGGLVGSNSHGAVSNSYSTGNVIGNSNIGGLVGWNYHGTVSNSYSTGNVTGEYDVGGLVGNHNEGAVSNSYSTGNVTGEGNVGGLVGANKNGNVSNSFWDIETSGQATSNGGTGKSTEQMQNITTFSDAGWDITEVSSNETNPAYVWNIVDGLTYPFLSWQS